MARLTRRGFPACLLAMGVLCLWKGGLNAFVGSGAAPGVLNDVSMGARLDSIEFKKRPFGIYRYAPSVSGKGAQVPLCLLGTMALAALGASRLQARKAGQTKRQTSVTRMVTLEDIETLTVDDVPANFYPKMRLGVARRVQYAEAIRAKLEDTFFVMGFNYTGFQPADLRAARESFPDGVIVRALKNSMMRKATEGTGWEDFGKACSGSNMYVFVPDDKSLKPTIEAYLKMEKKYKRKAVLLQLLDKEKSINSDAFRQKLLVGGCIRDEWTVIDPEDIPKLKDFPTKSELIARIAGGIKAVTQNLARGTKQITQKIAIGTKKVVEKGEEQGKSVVKDITP